jgi:hypothetical protein
VIAEQLAEFEATLLAMHDCRVETGAKPGKWNRLVDKLQGLQLTLRESPEGRAGIARLIESPNPTVQGWAAAYSLFWDEPAARACLEKLEESRGLASTNAKYTLREFDAGRLNMTWVPRTAKG